MKRRLILFIMIQIDNEIKELMEQKKKIEERIKFLQHRYWKCRRVDIEYEERYVGRSCYAVKINFHSEYVHKERRVTISECFTMDNTITDLKALKSDLEEIIKQMEVENDL